MSSVAEHLAALSQAVPALPGKVEAVAHDAEALDQAARAAIADFRRRREQATQVVDQLRQALGGLRDRTSDERQQLEQAAHALQDAAAHDAHELGEASQQLHGGSGEAATAFAALQAALAHGGERTRAAHEQARAALHALGDHARSKRAEIEAAVHEVTAAVKSTEDAAREGAALVSEGVHAVTDAMARVLQDVRHRLEQTRSRLDDLHAQQEAAVADALKELETQSQHVEDELSGRVDGEMEQPLDRELSSLAGTLAELGQHVQALQEDCSSRREQLEQQVASVADRIPPLQGAVEQVKGAAGEAGIHWP